jgi:hypothetical protein
LVEITKGQLDPPLCLRLWKNYRGGMVLPPVVVFAGGVVPVLGGVPPAGVVPAGQGPVAAAGALPVAVPVAVLVAPGRVPAAVPVCAPVSLFGLAAVPAPVPVVVEGTQVTGAMPVGFELPIAPLVLVAGGVVPGAGVTPPGVCVTG